MGLVSGCLNTSRFIGMGMCQPVALILMSKIIWAIYFRIKILLRYCRIPKAYFLLRDCAREECLPKRVRYAEGGKVEKKNGQTF